jgi:hypothetical protein
MPDVEANKIEGSTQQTRVSRAEDTLRRQRQMAEPQRR